MTTSHIPELVDAAENIVRCICSPYHFDRRKKRLHWKAFQPAPGTDAVSVIRADFMGADFCKRHGQALADPSTGKFYEGLAAFRAGSARASEMDVIDSRSEYVGHADLKHGFSSEIGEPRSPEITDKIVRQCKALLAQTQFFTDPDPLSDRWIGATLTA